MASNPPFQVEDTDEDFFDKLVNDDDDDFKVTPLSTEAIKLADGNDSDDAKAFANLGISDVGTGLEDLGKVNAGESSSSINGDIIHDSTDTCIDPGHPLVSSNSFAFDSVVKEPNNEVTGLEEPLDSWDHGSGGAPGVKEVQWAAFTTEPVESGSNGFGSYNDFFTEFGDGSVDQIGKEGNLVSKEQDVVSGAGGSSSVIDESVQRKNVDDYSQDIHAYATATATATAGEQNAEVQAYATAGGQSADGQYQNSSEYWENLYPGWKYDANTGQWYQVSEGHDANVQQGAHDLNTAASEWTASNEVSYSQQTVQSVVGAVTEKGTTESVTTWNQASQATHTNEISSWDQASQENNGYPSHMVFDPQYPGWYYDMNTQEWCSLDAYNAQQQVNQNGYPASSTNYYGVDHNNTYGRQDQLHKQQGSTTWQPAQDQVNQNGTNTYYGNDELEKQPGSEVSSSQGQEYKWQGSISNVEQKESSMSMWQPDSVVKSAPISDFRGNQQRPFRYEGAGAASSLKIHEANSEYPGPQSGPS